MKEKTYKVTFASNFFKHCVLKKDFSWATIHCGPGAIQFMWHHMDDPHDTLTLDDMIFILQMETTMIKPRRS